MKLRSSLAMFAALVIVGALSEIPAQAAGKNAGEKIIFLSPADYNPQLLLPPPPADNSPENKVELAELHRIQNEHTAAELAKAKQDGETENATIFEETLGSGFTLKAYPVTAKLMSDVRNDEREAVAVAKKYFKRSRPWVVDPTLVNCSRSDKPKSSYPSGHTTMAFSMAVVLAALAPAKAQALLTRAEDYGHSRLVCEQHWRHDVEAGQAYGTAIGQALLRNADFRKDYDSAAAELRAGHIIP